jgi:transposase-like protein
MPRRVWSPEDKVRIVLESLNTNISLADLCRKYNLNPNVFYHWKEKFIEGGKLALSGAIRDPAREKAAEIDRLKKLIGELTIANEAMKEVLSGAGKK